MEGCDGVGKTTLANRLADYFGCDIVHLTEKGSKLFEDYYAKAVLNNIIMDRCFLSELVYSTVFNRESKVKVSAAEKLLEIYRDNDWQIIILTADKERLAKQLDERNDEDEEKVEMSREISLTYASLSWFYKIPTVDMSVTTFEELTKNLEERRYVIR